MSRIASCDVGTMFFQTAERMPDGGVETQMIRNAFVELSDIDDAEDTLRRNGWNYVRKDDKFFVVGEDALQVARWFSGRVELRRPLQSGVLNKGEEQKLVVLDYMVEKTIGTATDDKSYLTTCVSSPSVDGAIDSAGHRRRLEALFKGRGWNTNVIEEAYAVVLGERPKAKEEGGSESPMSGIGVSCGAGRVNCVLVYKGVVLAAMSAARSGDWIDEKVQEETGLPLAQITSYKENKLDLSNPDLDSDLAFALDTYYEMMISDVFKMFSKKFSEVKGEHSATFDIVVAGGTSTVPGFIPKMKEIVSKLELPFKVGDVRHAKNPRNAVAEGCLAHAAAMAKKTSSANIVDPDKPEF